MHCIATASAPILHPASLWQGECFRARRGGKKEIVSGTGCGFSPVSSRQSTRQVVLHKEIYGADRLLLTRLQSQRELDGQRAGKWRLEAHASVIADPAVWVIRTAVFYVLLEMGIATRSRSLQDFEENGPLAWFQKVLGPNEEQQKAKELAKVRRQWHASTKGTLVRKYRVPSKAGGRKLLVAISSLLADDDTFRDVATSKGCQIRRENAHAESVCCHNVRALFDELPTPHLVVDITVFPAGPITDGHYEKAAKLEKVLRTGASI